VVPVLLYVGFELVLVADDPMMLSTASSKSVLRKKVA